MGWLDQIKAKRAASNSPADGKTAFAGYEFTDDRREKARRAQQELQDATSVFQNVRREQDQEEHDSGQPVVTQVEFEGDKLDAHDKRQVERGKPRRSARRIRTPLNLYYFPTPDHFVPLELTVIYRASGTKAIDCFLYDVNDQGIGFASPVEFPADSELTVLGHHAEEMTPLVATHVTIVNSRPFPADKEPPEKFAGRPLWLHGTRMELEDAMLLYKATLDSIALHVALAESSGEAAEEGAELAADEDPEIPESAED